MELYQSRRGFVLPDSADYGAVACDLTVFSHHAERIPDARVKPVNSLKDTARVIKQSILIPAVQQFVKKDKMYVLRRQQDAYRETPRLRFSSFIQER